jgi:cytochrome c556
MKHIRSALAAVALSFGAAAVGSAQQSTPTQPQAHAQHGQRAKGAKRLRGALRHQLFKGITLSDAEKANVKAVQAKYAPQMKALREQFKPQLKAARDARQRGDTAALKNLWQQSSAQRAQTAKLLEAERSDLRNALSAQNQLKFDANVQRLEQHVAQRAQKVRKNLKGGAASHS